MSSMTFSLVRPFGRRAVREAAGRQDVNVPLDSWPYGASGRITAHPWEGLSLIETETELSSENSGLSG
ncbi:hypothetical protein [Arthrobacter mobilis]|uniref:Uncharacterized protein n=1 Tax=Arthrobacter mobilis TaxID=2724944 RepID=A0A7X6QMD1_9MICC|nr:hypothetical protein [Arthrobacter mobilis]NKX56538.1 hypothetical protein [Arthrobacter mobilis]